MRQATALQPVIIIDAKTAKVIADRKNNKLLKVMDAIEKRALEGRYEVNVVNIT